MADKQKTWSFTALQTVYIKPFEEEGDVVINIKSIDIIPSQVLVITASINSTMILSFYILKTAALIPSQFNRYLKGYFKVAPSRSTAIGANTPYVYNPNFSKISFNGGSKVSARTCEFYFDGSTVFPAGSTGTVEMIITYEVTAGTDAELALLEYI
jgi:hypothetical protein